MTILLKTNKTMRAFIAVDLSKESKDYLTLVESQFKKSNADVKWIEQDNLHITLKFLGDIDEEQAKKLITAITDIASKNRQFNIKLGQTGAFPSIRSPRIIWVGVTKGDAELKKIAAEIELCAIKTGVPAENKPFSSHITIGRTRSNLNREKLIQHLNSLNAECNAEPPESIVKNITFYKSTLTPKGPIYEILIQVSLVTT